MVNICAPALIYLIFSLIQIIIDTFKGFYNTALVEFFVMMLMTYLLNLLCQGGMSIISWIIVFIPFILKSVIVAILLYAFGLDPQSGIMTCPNDKKNENKGGNHIFTNQPQM
jgi:predicted membrane protein